MLRVGNISLWMWYGPDTGEKAEGTGCLWCFKYYIEWVYERNPQDRITEFSAIARPSPSARTPRVLIGWQGRRQQERFEGLWGATLDVLRPLSFTLHLQNMAVLRALSVGMRADACVLVSWWLWVLCSRPVFLQSNGCLNQLFGRLRTLRQVCLWTPPVVSQTPKDHEEQLGTQHFGDQFWPVWLLPSLQPKS